MLFWHKVFFWFGLPEICFYRFLLMLLIYGYEYLFAHFVAEFSLGLLTLSCFLFLFAWGRGQCVVAEHLFFVQSKLICFVYVELRMFFFWHHVFAEILLFADFLDLPFLTVLQQLSLLKLIHISSRLSARKPSNPFKIIKPFTQAKRLTILKLQIPSNLLQRFVI